VGAGSWVRQGPAHPVGEAAFSRQQFSEMHLPDTTAPDTIRNPSVTHSV